MIKANRPAAHFDLEKLRNSVIIEKEPDEGRRQRGATLAYTGSH